MNKPAAIRGTFADFRLIKGRKVAQLVVELPIEEADAALQTLGGLPQPAAERWVALARLENNVQPIKQQQDKRRFEDLKAAMQAGIRCNEPAFWRFLNDYFDPADGEITNDIEAANVVRRLCGVTSRSKLNLDPRAADSWRNLESQYQAWLRVPACEKSSPPKPRLLPFSERVAAARNAAQD